MYKLIHVICLKKARQLLVVGYTVEVAFKKMQLCSYKHVDYCCYVLLNVKSINEAKQVEMLNSCLYKNK